MSPLQWYTCVEFVDFPVGTDDIVRFGTYGSGIWDFKISEPPPSATSDAYYVNIYPNSCGAYGEAMRREGLFGGFRSQPPCPKLGDVRYK